MVVEVCCTLVTLVADLFDPDLFMDRVADGYVRLQQHPAYPLTIANYTPKAQYERVWDEVTSQCRGLIYNHVTAEVVSRPFAKFFNWDEGQVKIPHGPTLVAPKMDGSLGVLYRKPDIGAGSLEFAYAVASRGSFTSEQAVEGSKMFREEALNWMFFPKAGRTYLFEIIYPENRIVVDYGQNRRLVLLDVIDNDTGRRDQAAFDEARWPDKVEQRVMPFFTENLVHDIRDNEEGWVFYFPQADLRVKMKGAEYVRLHKIITNCTARTIWEYLSAGRSLSELLENVPDEFYGWVKQTSEDLYRQHFEISRQINDEFDAAWSLTLHDVGGQMTPDERLLRKEFAKFAKDATHPSAMFALFDGREIDEYVWKQIRPEHTKPFWADEEG